MENRLYKCKICPHKYKEKKWAKRCGSWCAIHKNCNLEIIRHATNLKEWHISFAERKA